MKAKRGSDQVARVAQMFSAMGSAPRVEILRLLLAAHPNGLVAGEIQAELKIPASTLSHHLDKLKSQGLVKVRRERQYLWYSADSQTLRGLLEFLFAECCTRNQVIAREELISICR